MGLKIEVSKRVKVFGCGETDWPFVGVKAEAYVD
jgi:hypothetical protein